MDPSNPALPGSTQSVTSQPSGAGNNDNVGNLISGVQQPADNPFIFPKPADMSRLRGYEYFDKLYFGNHYDAFSMKAQQTFSDQYSRLRYITANFAGLMSRVMADMLFGEQITFDFANNQDWADTLIEQNAFKSQLYESALANSRRGDSVFKLRVGQRNASDPSSPATIIIEETPPTIYFPVLSPQNARYTPSQEVIAWQFMQGGKCYLHKETHTPGYITHEIFAYDPRKMEIGASYNAVDFGFQPIEETGVKHVLVFHIPNVRDSSGYFGTSDYFDLTQLFFALNNRLSKTDSILDSHSDPILAVPPGIIDENGNFKKEALHLFEVDNENAGFNKPEYITWNANLEYAFKQVDNLVNLLFMFSEISPGSVGYEQTGSSSRIESGRALKLKLIRTIAKRNRKKIYYDQAIKDILEVAQELAIAQNITLTDAEGKALKITKAERPKIDWGDGLIQDATELIANAVSRVDAGLSSRADAIAGLDSITPEEAADKVTEIDKENTSDLKFAGTTPPDPNNPNPDFNTNPPPQNSAGKGPADPASNSPTA